MVFDATPIYVSFAIASLAGVVLYFICQLREEVEPSPILLAAEKQKAKEQKTREKLTACLSPQTIQVKEEHLKFVIQCCDIESSCCSNKCIQCPDKEDIDDSDLTYSPRLMIPMGVNDYGREYGETYAKCAICIDDFCEGDIVVGSINHLECSHIFHFDCILAWFSKSTGDSGNYYCPVCRQLFAMDE